ncbi:MAG: hypothetical protein US36_C0019G0004 [Candidatus Wolfebacteria bacterium GW2011_GWC1_37_10]|uniref:Uncharacterized protein n=1 Tax=Candidatus Wolfebacteria bacterium GW2011_GWC1_37_10 TaxID=1619010 RepID=A0A0G0FQX4_9BACT|nr:MAG: hypothetical protein US36_C0019G0004 [Candidatus Wolfebacteria bacterium GW2011_GWC1_37_10]
MEEDKKIPLPATILIMLYIGLLDLVGILLVFVGLDDFLILDILTFPVTQFYFRIKGVAANADLAASILELIPYVGALPIKSIGVALTIYLANRQKIVPPVGETA